MPFYIYQINPDGSELAIAADIDSPDGLIFGLMVYDGMFYGQFQWQASGYADGKRSHIELLAEPIPISNVKLTGVKFKKDSVVLLPGETTKVQLMPIPADATLSFDGVLKLSSSNTTSVVVKDWMITAKSYGTATITAKCGQYTAICKVTVAPKTPVLINAKAKAYDKIQVQWRKASGAQGYYIYRRTGSRAWERISTVKGGSTTTYTDTSVLPGITYDYTVRARRKVGKSYVNSGYDKNGVTAKTSLSAPMLLSAKKKGASMQITWKKTAGANGYYIYRKTAGASWTRIGKTSALTWTDKKAAKKTVYIYTVRGYRKVNGKTVLGKYSSKGIAAQ